jgi:hypothetical protein
MPCRISVPGSTKAGSGLIVEVMRQFTMGLRAQRDTGIRYA